MSDTPILIVLDEPEKISLTKGTKIQKQIEQSDRQRNPFTRIWDLCNLYLQGKQHIRWDKNLKNYVGNNTSGKSRREQVTVNLILNMYRNLLARYSVAYPSTTVMPASPSLKRKPPKPC